MISAPLSTNRADVIQFQGIGMMDHPENSCRCSSRIFPGCMNDIHATWGIVIPHRTQSWTIQWQTLVCCSDRNPAATYSSQYVETGAPILSARYGNAESGRSWMIGLSVVGDLGRVAARSIAVVLADPAPVHCFGCFDAHPILLCSSFKHMHLVLATTPSCSSYHFDSIERILSYYCCHNSSSFEPSFSRLPASGAWERLERAPT